MCCNTTRIFTDELDIYLSSVAFTKHWGLDCVGFHRYEIAAGSTGGVSEDEGLPEAGPGQDPYFALVSVGFDGNDAATSYRKCPGCGV